MSEDRFTGKLRVWFNAEAKVGEPPGFFASMPWRIAGDTITSSAHTRVAKFYSFDEMVYACNAANKHHALSTVVATVYNRIRRGDVLFDGSEADVRLWQEAKKLLGP